MSSKRITQEELKALVAYDPETGIFTWLKNKGSRAAVGKPAGSFCKTHKYFFLRLNKKLYRAHHLVWLYVYGRFPEKDIDHINQQRDDNRLINLREVDRAINNYNTANRKGYCKHGNKFRAYLVKKGKQKHLGTFNTEEEASAAYEKAKRQLLSELCGS